METYLTALILGVVEGLTEFLPVSSTGHLIVVGSLLGFEGPAGNVFEIIIQLGAIMAICWLYRVRIAGIMVGMFSHEARAQRFFIGLTLAVIPAAIMGALFHDVIKQVLFNPLVVAIALIVGGVVLLIVERKVPPSNVYDFEDIPVKTAFFIGCFQVFALIPGVSRAGATIIGGLLCGVQRRAAAEFSFFLAIPTMLGATSYDLYKNWMHLQVADAQLIGVGFIAAFISAVVVVKFMLNIVTRHGFAPFAWYRIIAGSAIMVWLLA